MSFVHLRLHSEFSVVDGLVQLKQAAAAAAADGQGALALTDSAAMFGAVRFYTAAREQGVKPIIGVDAFVSNETDRDSPHRLLLLAIDHGGYLDLCDLVSRAWIENQNRGRGEMRLDWLGGRGGGLIALSAFEQGAVGAQLAFGNMEAARAAAQRLAQLFPDRFYIEVQRAGRPGDEALVRASARLAIDLDLPLAATHPVQFLAREDFRAHEARVCIAEGYTLADPRRPRRFTEEQYFKSRDEMARLFADMPAALANTVEIARRCNLELTLGKSQLPDFPTPPGVGIEQHCRDLAQAGLEQRLEQLYPERAAREQQRPRYQSRLDFELATIAKMGFSGYFLIVADFINWAKRQGIPVGPGRGSGAGSLVAYSLAITDLDPLRYDLLFERFLNPERVSMPDFDIDFCQDNRDRVIDYVKQKYGAHAVAQIATFGTLGAKAVVRDVGRVLDLPYSKCDALSKLIPHNPADPWTLDRALAQEPAFAEAVAGDEEYAELVELSRPLEGLTRNVGMHAGGVLIAPGKLTDFCPLYAAGAEAAVISQYDKDDIDAIGLVKFDFLGLTTLTILDLTLRYVRRLDPGFALTLETLPLDDAATYEVFKQAATAAIFQFESRGMRELLKRARPDRLDDLIALNALYRPGPMDLIPEFVERKHGRRKVEYLHPSIEPILAQTYGVMVYQEQVMRIAQDVAGYSLGDADLLRRAMGKKKPEEMAKQRSGFVDGARAKGIGEGTATQLFDLMEKFAGYGFNKCVVGETRVRDAVTGAEHTVRELFERRRALDLHVHALDAGWRLQARRVRDVVWNGRRRVYELRTALGRRLVATGNHPLRTLDGWTTLRDLKPGDRIAAPRSAPVARARHWPEHELIVLGGLLSEGNTCHPTCVYFYNNDDELVADFVRAAVKFPQSVARVARRGARREVCVSTGRDARFRAGQRPWNARGAVAVAVDEAAPRRSGLFEWASGLGILGIKAQDKRVPALAFDLAAEDIAILLGRMWSGDGFLFGASNTVPFYATSSAGLARDVQELLLRVGVVSRIQKKQFGYRGGSRPGHAVFPIGDDGVRRFVDVVLPNCVGRSEQAAKLSAYVRASGQNRSSKDTIPAEVRRWVDRARRDAGLTWREVEDRSGLSMREFLGRGSRGKRGFRRATLARLSETLDCGALRALASSDVYWDTVTEIVPAGVQDVYDLEVDGEHNFVADGLVVHNSHSAAYAVLAYQTAYFKTHYPAAFMAANLSALMGETDKVRELVADSKAMGLVILGPDINEGGHAFEPVDARTIRYGLGAIKGTGRGAIEHLVETRAAGGPFKGLFDFCARLDKQFVNRRVAEALVRAGAFDALDPDRARLAASVGRALEAADRAAAHAGQASLFGADTAVAPAEEYASCRPWNERERLANEKLALGYYFSGHLFRQYQDEARRLAPTRLADLRGSPGGRPEAVRLAGIIVSARTQNTRRGRMGVIMLDDGTAQLELTIFAELYDRKRALLREDTLVFVLGKARYDEVRERLSINADEVMDLAEARARAAARVRIEIDGAPDLQRLRGALAPFRVANGAVDSGCRVVLHYRNGVGAADLLLPEEWRVRADESLIEELRQQPRVTSAGLAYL
jgi:DNA polymerase-3 subunit alpha